MDFNEDIDGFKTFSHEENEEFNQNIEDDNEVLDKKQNLLYDLKTLYRLLRKKFIFKVREKMQKNFTNILYVTLDCPPFTQNSYKDDNILDYIVEIRNQYPENNIKILIPIININETHNLKKLTLEINNKTEVLEKTSISFDFFLQNRTQTATVYKFPKNQFNIDVYGIYSPSFSKIKNVSELSKLHFLAPFIKSTRIVVKKLVKEGFNPDIIHCENIPYFLGTEFESSFFNNIKVLQVVKDFTQINMTKHEAFWAAINLSDNFAMGRICRDDVIKKCIAKLFNLHNTKRFYQMKECLYFIYKNYYKFRKFVDKGEDIEENIIFNKLNERIFQLFPQILNNDNLYFNPMISSLKKANLWATTSKTYYKEIFENPLLSGNLFELIEKTKEKSCCLSYGCNLKKYPTENTRLVYQDFNIDNFREMRNKNKSLLLKEFNIDRIKTNFIDSSLFKNGDYKILGSLDSFYEAPLFFANPTTEIFANGVDVLFNTVLKLFELHKNIQIIICIKDGLKNNFIKNWLEFLSQNKYFNGRWVFIDGDINLPKFLSASDMILLPQRTNTTSIKHFVAMKYGCVPIASRCGVFNDTIADIFDDISNGCGLKTKKSLLVNEDVNEIFLTPVIKALNLYQNNPNSWNLLIKNCMNKDSDWNFNILEKYNNVYQKLI